MRKYRSAFLLAGAGLLLAYIIAGFAPASGAAPQAMPNLEARLQYRDFFIIDNGTGFVLNRLSSRLITVGDEYVAENNRRYIVSKVDGNIAYAEFLGAYDSRTGVLPKINKNR